MNWCRLNVKDRARLEALTGRLRRSLQGTQPASLRIARAAILRALLRQGLDLAKTREITGKCASQGGPPVLLSFRITPEDGQRLNELRQALKARSPLGELPPLAEVQRVVLRMALAEGETLAGFPRFVRAALASRLPPASRARP